MTESRKSTLTALAVSAFAFALYLPSLGNGFVNWDDPNYVTANPAMGPLGVVDYVVWASGSWFSNNWHPLTWISLGIDYAIYGRESATGYHATSALLHAANCFLVVSLAMALFRRSKASDALRLCVAGLVGLVFAAHPLHVESVVWVSERKDVLYAFFFLSSLLAYLRYVDAEASGRSRWYAAALGLFCLSLLAKPMAVALPIVLVIVDAVPLARLAKNPVRIAIVEKLPFYALSLASAWVTVAAQTAGGALTAVELPLIDRLLLAERAIGFYLVKFVWPTNLSPLYPLPESYSIALPEFALSLALCLAISVIAIVLVKRAPALLAGWMAFGAMLAPVIGIVQVGDQAAADRYLYLPMLAPLLLLAAPALRLPDGAPIIRALLGFGSLLTIGLASLSLSQMAIWENSITLWQHQVSLYPESTTGRQNLGTALTEAGDVAGAQVQFEEVLRIDPTHAWAATDLGNIAKQRGDLAEAERLYRIAIAANPYFAAAQLNLATTLDSMGRGKEAVEHYLIFLRVAPPQHAAIAAQVKAKLLGQ